MKVCLSKFLRVCLCMCVLVCVCDREIENQLGPWPDKWIDKLAEHIYFLGWGMAFSLQNGCLV